jgi:hypothetical protein
LPIILSAGAGARRHGSFHHLMQVRHICWHVRAECQRLASYRMGKAQMCRMQCLSAKIP